MPPTRPLNEIAASFAGTQGTEFSFSSADAAQPAWKVRTAHLREAVSAPYFLRLELVATSAPTSAATMLGKDAQLSWQKDGLTCCVQGIVTSVHDGDSNREIARSHVTIEPALAALKHSTASRIFEHQSIPDVVTTVLREKLQPFGRSVVLGPMDGEYPVHEYIAQHRETDFDFVARLLAEHGLWYYFDHRPDEKLERLVITDSPKQAPAVENGPDIRLSRDKETRSQQQAITSLGASDTLCTTDLRIRYFDWTVPRLPIEVTKQAKDPAALSLERYEHGDVTSLEYKEPRYGKDDAQAQAQLRLDAYRADRHSLTGASNVVSLRPGHFMKVADHEYLITSVTHHGDIALNTGQAAHLGDYRNGFTCVPRDQAYRPERQPKPRIHGPQTAIVVNGIGDKAVPHSGSGGSDISTDRHGRVRVKFHWDTSPTPEDKKQDKNSNEVSTTSAWIRVAQGWAGVGWGVQFIPRVGMEVIVHFIDGDPDRPIITGCVYNGQNWPPYRDKPTQSGIKTASSVDRERYNEIRFDDTNGAEQLYVRAQMDCVEEVLQNHTTTVSGSQTQIVKKSQTETVEEDQNLTVKGKRTKSVGGIEEKGERNTILGERYTQVTKAETQAFNQTRTITVDQADTLTVNNYQRETIKIGREVHIQEKDDKLVVKAGSKVTQVEQQYMLKAQGEFSIVQGSDGKSKVVLSDKVFVTSQGDITLISDGKAKLYADPSGKIKIEAAEEIKLECGAASISLKADGTVKIHGKSVSVGTDKSGAVFSGTGSVVKGVMVEIN